MSDTRFAELKQFTDRIGPVYGTEDWSTFMYALAKMHKPVNAVELGTGLGATALWVALAMRENGFGKLHTIDNGRDWPQILADSPDLFSPAQRQMSFAQYMDDLRQRFGLADHLEPIHRDMPPFPQVDQKLDLLFSDFMHGPNEVLSILGHFLPGMAEASSIFIDSASTSFPSFALLELLIDQLNAGKAPQMLLAKVAPEKHDTLWQQIRTTRYQLIHMVEKKNRVQNSTAWIKLSPVDLRPYPSAPFH